MNYKDVIIPEKIENYKEQHRIMYITLNSIIFDISFLEACVELQDNELNNDWITIKILHKNIFENLVLKIYKCFFDNSGTDSTNILRFKNNVVRKFLKKEYRRDVIEQINNISLPTDFINRQEQLRDNIFSIRKDFVAHRLLQTNDNAIVDLNEIKMMFEYGCNLFHVLSFEPQDFYSFIEGDGYDFFKEINYTYKSVRKFIKTSFLTSNYITKIDCQFDDYCDETIKRRLQTIIDDLNTNGE